VIFNSRVCVRIHSKTLWQLYDMVFTCAEIARATQCELIFPMCSLICAANKYFLVWGDGIL